MKYKDYLPRVDEERDYKTDIAIAIQRIINNVFALESPPPKKKKKKKKMHR